MMKVIQTLVSSSTCAALTWLATASSTVTKTVGVWDASTGREVATLEGYGGIAHSCAW
jgi:hypothetical protein